jgi:DNA gyrase subunit A
MEKFRLTQIQAQAILDMQLRRLAALERQKIVDEYTEVLRNIAYLEDLLANPRKILFLIKQDVTELKDSYGDARRTQISVQGVLQFGEEDLIAHQEVVVTISNRGYIKRVSVDAFRSQRRGGRGLLGMSTREEDGTRHLRIADTHDHLLFFTTRGWVFRLKCHELPGDSSRTSRGTPLINLVSLQSQDQVTAVVTARNLVEGDYIVLATARGEVKKTSLDEFAVVRSNGLIAMDLEAGDELVAAVLVGDDEEVMLVTEKGKSIRFTVKQLRSASRTSGGVRGIKLSPADRVVDMVRCSAGEQLLVVSANGFGKRSNISAYPKFNRGGGGVITFKINDKTGALVAAEMVYPDQELMLLSAEGIVIRITVRDIAIQGRSTQGVSLMKLDAGDRVVSVACLDGRPHVAASGS